MVIGGSGNVVSSPCGGYGGGRPCGRSTPHVLGVLSQGVGSLEKEEQVLGVRTSLLNTPSAERGW